MRLSGLRCGRTAVISALAVLGVVGAGISGAGRAQAIVGGQPVATPMSAVPSLVFQSVLSADDCTGVLVSPSWVLTAQHCTNENEKQGHPYGAKNVTVTFHRPGGSKESRKVSGIVRANPYSSATGVGDIALLHLVSAVTDIAPMPILASGAFASLEQVTRFGWGITSPTGTKPSSVLRYSVEAAWREPGTQYSMATLGVPVARNCAAITWPSGNALWTYNIGQGGNAEGDSGGPVTTEIAPSSYAVAGITSSVDNLTNCKKDSAAPNSLGKEWLGLSNRVDQDSAEWGFLTANVPGLQVTSGGSWTSVRAPLPADANAGQSAYLASVSCTSATSCLAVGYYNGEYSEPVIETRTATGWTASEPPLPADAFPYNQSSALNSVSCANGQSCAAVGTYEDASTTVGLIETITNGTATASRAPVPGNPAGDPYNTLSVVTCPAAGSCFALGQYDTSNEFDAMIDTLSGGNWTAVAAPLPPDASPTEANAYLDALNCTSASYCVAVGQYTDTNGNTDPLVETDSNGAWSAVAAPLPTGATTSDQDGSLDGVACWAAGACAATGSYSTTDDQGYGLLENLTSGTWTPTVAPLPADAATSGQSVAFGESPNSTGSSGPIACPAAGTCVAVGMYRGTTYDQRPLIEQFANGSWAGSAAPTPGAGTGAGMLYSVSCPSAQACVLAGAFQLPDEGHKALVVTLDSGSPAATEVTSPSDAASVDNADLNGLSCVSVTACAGVGQYNASDGTTQSMLASSG